MYIHDNDLNDWRENIENEDKRVQDRNPRHPALGDRERASRRDSGVFSEVVEKTRRDFFKRDKMDEYFKRGSNNEILKKVEIQKDSSNV